MERNKHERWRINMNKIKPCYVCDKDLGLFAGNRVVHQGLCNTIYKGEVRRHRDEEQKIKKEMAERKVAERVA